MTDVQTSEVWVAVQPPPVVEHPFGLFSVAPPVAGTEAGWQVGVTWQSSAGCVEVGFTSDPCITGETVTPKQPTTCPPFNTAKPFIVYSYLTRSMRSLEVTRSEVEAGFAAAEQRGVESYLWNDQLPGAVRAHWQVPAGQVAHALGLVELALAQTYNGTGIIHMDRATATALGNQNLRVSGASLLTMLGTPVVVGAGYGPDLGVAGTPGGAATPAPSVTGSIYGTGALAVRRDQRDTLEGFDRAVNDALVIAERTYVVAWDCVAVRADIPIGGT